MAASHFIIVLWSRPSHKLVSNIGFVRCPSKSQRLAMLCNAIINKRDLPPPLHYCRGKTDSRCNLLKRRSVTQNGATSGLVQVASNQIAGAVPRIVLDLLLWLLVVM